MTNDSFNKTGKKIEWDEEGKPLVPNHPIIPYIIGDGTGPDIWVAARPVFDAAVEKAYGGEKQIVWKEVLAGEKAQKVYGTDSPLPEKTLEDIANYGVAIKGPLTTPVGGGYRSLNVSLRQILDLYACVRPVRFIPGVPSPMRNPEKVDVIIFRENTEDVYAGLEWPAGSAEAREMIEIINRKYKTIGGSPVSMESAIGIKPMSEYNSSRVVSMAIRYALENRRKSITLMHKGNIMKYTEGAFRDWGYKVAREMFPDKTIAEQDLDQENGGTSPEGRVIIKDRIADAMFQQLLLRPEEYDVIVTPNLDGDYISDAAAAQVGGLGMAPGANIGDRCALFEAIHGSAPKYAGLDKVNPSSLILSGVEMLRYMGWCEAADLVVTSLVATLKDRIVTYDLARQMEDATEVKCSEFGEAVRKRIGA